MAPSNTEGDGKKKDAQYHQALLRQYCVTGETPRPWQARLRRALLQKEKAGSATFVHKRYASPSVPVGCIEIDIYHVRNISPCRSAAGTRRGRSPISPTSRHPMDIEKIGRPPHNIGHRTGSKRRREQECGVKVGGARSIAGGPCEVEAQLRTRRPKEGNVRRYTTPWRHSAQKNERGRLKPSRR